MRTKNTKIIKNQELGRKIELLRGQGKSVALCHGVFDLVHPGHIRHLSAASKESDILFVSVTSDQFVNKGPGRPVYNSTLRAETLAALECVDYVTISDRPTAIDIITIIKPDVYVKGADYISIRDDVTGMIQEEINAVEASGGRVTFTDEMSMSSSELINTYFDVFRPETQNWLKNLRNRWSSDDIIQKIYKIRDLKILVIGEAIIDDYFFCEGLGKSSKDPILAFRYLSDESHAGGSLAVANHVAGLCGKVGLISLLGETDSRVQFIKESLNSKIDFMPVRQTGAPTIHKRRFIDTHSGSKVFELYLMEDAPIDAVTAEKLVSTTKKVIDDFDVIIVTDYGHGMMTPSLIDLVENSGKFLAVNTQSNAGNRGLNTISKYKKADYVCLNGSELQLELKTRAEDFRVLVQNLDTKLDCKKYTVTLGREGTLHYDAKDGFTEIPALAQNVIDRVGAGDAVLSATAPLVSIETDWTIVGLIANLVGAEIVADMGNRNTLESANLIKHIMSILR